MDKQSICFVTNELYPLGPGGIGRMMFNFAKANAAQGFRAELHFLVPPDLVPDAEAEQRLADAFGDLAKVHVAKPLFRVPNQTAHLLDRASYSPWSLELLWSTSYRYYHTLLEIEAARGRPFDIIEFPDFGGWGLAAVEAKRAGLAFGQTLLAARLHSTQGVIAREERFFDPSYWNGLVMDAEAHLLRHADVIIGHEQFVLDYNRTHYDLAERWQGRTVLEFPAIILDAETETTSENLGTGRGAATDFVFSSRLQRFKRPDIFVRAAVAFAEKHPEHQGVFRLVSYGWDQPYIEWLEGLVPETLRKRVQFVYKASARERTKWLSSSIVVIPSDYESLCLFAYESSLMGASVILNRSCGVFGQGSRWAEGENCLMFDGSVEDLVSTMERALDWAPLAKVSIKPDVPYWLDPLIPTEAQPAPDIAPKPLSVALIGFGYETTAELERAYVSLSMLAAAPGLEALAFKVVLMVPVHLAETCASTLAQARAKGWEVQQTSGVEIPPESLRRAITALPCESVLLCEPGYAPRADFISAAATALARDPAMAAAGGLVEEIDRDTGLAQTVRCYGGEMSSQALISSRTVPLPSLYRKSLFERRSFDLRACSQWFEIFVRDCALAGEPIAILPMIAASLEGAALYRIENSSKLSAGIYDQAGLKAGLKARLLVLEPRMLDPEARRRREILPNQVLRAARMIAPQEAMRPFHPVRFLPEHEGVLVHPLAGLPYTLAEVTGPSGRLSQLSIETVLVSDCDGAEVALACVPEEAGPLEIEAVLDFPRTLPRGYAAVPWRLLPPGPPLTLNFSLRGASRGRDRIILASRLFTGGRAQNAEVLFRNLTVEHDAKIF